VPLLFGWPLVLTPMLIAFLELIIDPACSVVLEAEGEEEDVMRRPPRDPQAALLSPALIGWSVVQGALALVIIVLLFMRALFAGMPEDEIRALSFVTLVGANVALIFANRTFGASLRVALLRPNATLRWGLGLVALALALMFSWSDLRRVFTLGTLHPVNLGISVAAAFVLLGILELIKLTWRRRLSATM
jgi:Ca2+-transporting ATPase